MADFIHSPNGRQKQSASTARFFNQNKAMKNVHYVSIYVIKISDSNEFYTKLFTAG